MWCVHVGNDELNILRTPDEATRLLVIRTNVNLFSDQHPQHPHTQPDSLSLSLLILYLTFTSP